MTRKTVYKISFFVALGLAPTVASATYIDCRNAGGSMLDCFWEAAMKDGNILYKGGEENKNNKKITKKQLKSILQKREVVCGKLPLKEQKNCLIKGIKVNKKLKQKRKIVPTKFRKDI